jgi:hypothetical protein
VVAGPGAAAVPAGLAAREHVRRGRGHRRRTRTADHRTTDRRAALDGAGTLTRAAGPGKPSKVGAIAAAGSSRAGRLTHGENTGGLPRGADRRVRAGDRGLRRRRRLRGRRADGGPDAELRAGQGRCDGHPVQPPEGRRHRRRRRHGRRGLPGLQQQHRFREQPRQPVRHTAPDALPVLHRRAHHAAPRHRLHAVGAQSARRSSSTSGAGAVVRRRLSAKDMYLHRRGAGEGQRRDLRKAAHRATRSQDRLLGDQRRSPSPSPPRSPTTGACGPPVRARRCCPRTSSSSAPG